jgi:cysteine desulfurase / selenocysteine lyase
MLDPNSIRADFPILSRLINGKQLVYLDNAATSQKPRQVIDAIVGYYSNHNANVHRGVHTLSDESTELLTKSRQTIADFFGAENDELILVRNTTEAINGVAYGWADQHLKTGDVVLTTLMEHHSDLVVWQETCRRTGAKLEVIPVDSNGRLLLESLKEKLKTLPVKLVALTHVSNTLGTINPIEKIVQLIKSNNRQIKILVDGAQAAPHIKVDFHVLDVDFYIFSGHKMLGPMGIGGLLVKKELLSTGEMRPWLFGGGMIHSVAIEHTTYHDELSELFTAGTPDVASAVGLAAACNYLSQIGMSNVEAHDRSLVAYALEKLSHIKELTIIGPTVGESSALDRLGSVAFVYENVHAHDVAQVLDSEGIAVRSGHHCTMPLHVANKWQATTRASFQVYTTEAEIDTLVTALEKVKKVFG